MNRTFFAVNRGPNPWPLDQYDRAKHHHFDPRKQTPGGRHQIGTPAGFKSELVAGFLLECVAGFVGIRMRAFPPPRSRAAWPPEGLRNGNRIGPVSLDLAVRCAADRSEFVSIGLFEPSEAELRQLQENYNLHPLAIEDALLAHQLPKLNIHGDQLIVVPAQPISRMAKSGKTGLRPARSAVWWPSCACARYPR